MLAIADVYALSRPSLLRQARRLTGSAEDAEDLVHEVFVRFLEAEPEDRGGILLLGWLSITMRNLYVSSWRASR